MNEGPSAFVDGPSSGTIPVGNGNPSDKTVVYNYPLTMHPKWSDRPGLNWS